MRKIIKHFLSDVDLFFKEYLQKTPKTISEEKEKQKHEEIFSKRDQKINQKQK